MSGFGVGCSPPPSRKAYPTASSFQHENLATGGHASLLACVRLGNWPWPHDAMRQGRAIRAPMSNSRWGQPRGELSLNLSNFLRVVAGANLSLDRGLGTDEGSGERGREGVVEKDNAAPFMLACGFLMWQEAVSQARLFCAEQT